MRTHLPLLEATIAHTLRCASAATTQPRHDYWIGIFKHLIADYEARGGNQVVVDKSTSRWKVKVPETWLTPEERAPLSVT